MNAGFKITRNNFGQEWTVVSRGFPSTTTRAHVKGVIAADVRIQDCSLPLHIAARIAQCVPARKVAKLQEQLIVWRALQTVGDIIMRNAEVVGEDRRAHRNVGGGRETGESARNRSRPVGDASYHTRGVHTGDSGVARKPGRVGG